MPRPARRGGSRARRAIGACTGEARGSRPDRNRGADDGGRCLKGSHSEAGGGGRIRGSRDTSQTYL
jgi:hypothetical protein